MDIAKYIGLYLLKNNFVYLHGLGNLQILKKPAQYDGETLAGPQYEVQLMSSGSIDDSLANFIATAEQTSISKASNEIRNFVEQAKVQLAEGEQIAIPGIGHFTQQGGINRFVADANMAYVPPAIPALQMSKRLEEPPSFRRPTAEEEAEAQGNGGKMQKMLLMLLAAAAIIGLIVFAIRSMNKPTNDVPVEKAPEATPSPTAPPVTQQPATTTPADTATPAVTTSPTATPAPATNGASRIVLRSYPTAFAAEKRRKQLSTTPLGETVTVVPQDSSHYLVVIPFTGSLADSSRILDSLSRIYGSRAYLMP